MVISKVQLKRKRKEADQRAKAERKVQKTKVQRNERRTKQNLK